MRPPDRTYLDYNATAPLRPEAREAVISALDTCGNPSSVHANGRKARRIIEDARERVARLVGASPANVIFTSGATEANNWFFHAGWKTLFIPAIEHDSVLVPAAQPQRRIIQLPAYENGITRLEELFESISQPQDRKSPACATLQMANNETGARQPVADMTAFCRGHDIAVHTDAVQAAGRIKIDFQELGVDALSLSSHKIGGPAGAGALVVRDGFELPAFIAGGGQERRRRSGTENVTGIAGFGAAAECALNDLAETGQCKALRDELERRILEITPEAVILSANADRLPNTICLSLPGTSAETLLIKLDLAGIAVSSGAACSSGKVGASHVLSAMGLTSSVIHGAIRISLGWDSSKADVTTFLDVWCRITANAEQRAIA